VLDLLLEELKKAQPAMAFKIGNVTGLGRSLHVRPKKFIPGMGFRPVGEWQPITVTQAKAFLPSVTVLASPANRGGL